jgi:hypothetical protein
VAKLDATTGADLWRRTLRGSFVPTEDCEDEAFNQANAVTVDAAGDALVSGFLVNGDRGSTPPRDDSVVLKVSGADGSELWRRHTGRYRDSDTGLGSSIAVDAGGDVLSAGTALVTTLSGFTFYVIVEKLSGGDGSRLWRQTWAQAAEPGLTLVSVDRHDDVTVARARRPSPGPAMYVTLVKLEKSSGRERWRRELTGSSGPGRWSRAIGSRGFDDAAWPLAVGSDTTGNVLLAGSIHNTGIPGLGVDFDGDVVVGATQPIAAGPWAITLVKLSGSQGLELWRRVMDAHRVRSLTIAPRGDVVFAADPDPQPAGALSRIVHLSGVTSTGSMARCSGAARSRAPRPPAPDTGCRRAPRRSPRTATGTSPSPEPWQRRRRVSTSPWSAGTARRVGSAARLPVCRGRRAAMATPAPRRTSASGASAPEDRCATASGTRAPERSRATHTRENATPGSRSSATTGTGARSTAAIRRGGVRRRICMASSCLALRGPLLYCDDGVLCNGVESCDIRTGRCRPGTPPDCDDDNVCTDDTCEPLGGCVHRVNRAPCATGDPCLAGRCFGGRCLPTVTGAADIVCAMRELLATPCGEEETLPRRLRKLIRQRVARAGQHLARAEAAAAKNKQGKARTLELRASAELEQIARAAANAARTPRRGRRISFECSEAIEELASRHRELIGALRVTSR